MATPLRNIPRCPGNARLLATSLGSVVKAGQGPAPELLLLLPPPLLLLPPPPRPAGHQLSWPRFNATVGRRVEQVEVGTAAGEDSDPNKARLGATLRVLQERLPTLLQSPLPQDLLAPNISLQLFPTTHPHLPTVSGRVAYNAALWTSPIAWNRVPIIGNVKLDILAKHLTKQPLNFLPRRSGAVPEQLVVRWCEKKRRDDNDRDKSLIRSFWRSRGVDPNKAFTGLFIFDFDAQGRILTHTIEQAQEGGNWEKGVGAKFVSLTDWLLGEMSKPPDDSPVPAFEGVAKRSM
ncbi:hypothetical protein CP533_2347 [Ophiocordyceps camponoti-saundersi (nom. inval.)]|nr:hypothetical protein CP533_2347 [Ophiocordyceps camponoti-saundersi (nom. inval.)]